MGYGDPNCNSDISVETDVAGESTGKGSSRNRNWSLLSIHAQFVSFPESNTHGKVFIFAYQITVRTAIIPNQNKASINKICNLQWINSKAKLPSDNCIT